MKKIYTLLFVAMLSGSAFAQFGQRNEPVVNRDNEIDNYGYDRRGKYDEYEKYHKYEKHKGYDRHDNRSYVFTPRERDLMIDDINREIDHRIRLVHNRYVWNGFEKRKHIRFLEEERRNRIYLVLDRFNDPRNRFGDFNRKKYKKW